VTATTPIPENADAALAQNSDMPNTLKKTAVTQRKSGGFSIQG
jgi:hypothetical protein